MSKATPTTQPTGLDLLRAPFPANQISQMCRPTKRDNPKGSCKKCGGYHGLPAITLDYVGHAALTDRLLEADPNWNWEPMAHDAHGGPAFDKVGGMWIRLTVCGVTRIGYGHAEGKSGGDAIKEVIGDALRNAAMRFGAALDLWHKGDLHAHLFEEEPQEQPQSQVSPRAQQIGKEQVIKLDAALDAMRAATTLSSLKAHFADAWEALPDCRQALKNAYDTRKVVLEQELAGEQTTTEIPNQGN